MDSLVAGLLRVPT